LKAPSELFTVPPRLLPESPTLSHYRRVLMESSVPRAFLNSLVVSSVSVLISLAIGTPAAYGFARFRFPGAGAFGLGVLFTQLLPGAVVLVPYFIILTRLGLVNSLMGVALAYVVQTSPLAIWLLRGYVASVPPELEDAAQVDGCTRLGAVVRITMPAILPGLFATATYAFITAFEEFLFALVFTSSDRSRTLPVALALFKGEFETDWGGMMAASVLMTIPVLALFGIAGRYLLRGMLAGAVKG
ncbi:MAG: carbohydrate ABC transporter permease, partial [Bacillota bacterium]